MSWTVSGGTGGITDTLNNVADTFDDVAELIEECSVMKNIHRPGSAPEWIGLNPSNRVQSAAPTIASIGLSTDLPVHISSR